MCLPPVSAAVVWPSGGVASWSSAMPLAVMSQ